MWTPEIDERVEAVVREFAAKQPNDYFFIEFLEEDGPAGGLRFALDVASAEGLDVPAEMIDVAHLTLDNLDQHDRLEAGFAYSIRNSLKLLGVRELMAP